MRDHGRGVVSVMTCTLLFTAPLFAAQDPPLPVPAYPNWTLRQIDQKTDAESKTEGTLFQYVSNDAADRIVRFYEQATGRQAVFLDVSAMYTVYAPDGTMVNVTAPRGRGAGAGPGRRAHCADVEGHGHDRAHSGGHAVAACRQDRAQTPLPGYRLPVGSGRRSLESVRGQ